MKRTKKLEYAIKFAKFCQQIDLSPSACADLVELAEDAAKATKNNSNTKAIKRFKEYCKNLALKPSEDCLSIKEFVHNIGQTDWFQIP